MPQLQVCPRCSAARGSSLRFCPTCGLDYWDLASREALPTDLGRRPAAHGGSGGGLSSVLVTVGGILGVLAVCGFVMLAFLRVDTSDFESGERGDALAGLPDIFASGIPLTGDATRVVDAFMAEIDDPETAFHVEMEGTLATLTGPGGLRLSEGTLGHDIDVVGDSFAGLAWATGPTPDDNYSTEMVYIDGDVWIRPEGDHYWTSGTYEEPMPVNPLRAIGRGDVEYIGSETRAGEVVHHLRTRKWLGADVDSVVAYYDVDVTGHSSVSDIYVTDAGVPISMRTLMTVSVTKDFVRATVEIAMDYTFSSWDAPITIVPPS